MRRCGPARTLGLRGSAAALLLTGCAPGPGPGGLPPAAAGLWTGILLVALAIGVAWAWVHWDAGAAQRELDRRFARGEIERDAYLRAIADLESARARRRP